VLDVRGLSKSFGALAVAQSVDLKLAAGARHALIGPNGAGKTTIINLLTGSLKPNAGQILLDGENLVGLPPHARARRGLARTHQVNSLFLDLTPLQSVALAIAQRDGYALRFWGYAKIGRRDGEEAAALLEATGLRDRMHQRTRLLPYGQQRLLEVALALAGKPKVLLLDEPAAGVSAEGSERLFALLGRLPAELAILLVEHDMSFVFRFANRISVLAGGALLAEGTPQEIATDERVREVYLGKKHAQIA